MEAATYSYCPAKQITNDQRKALAYNALVKKQPISQIANCSDVSRKFIYVQKSKAVKAIDDAFNKPKQESKVLFYIPVTKEWLCMVVLCLLMHCRSSFRGVIKFCSDILDFKISVGTISNISQAAIKKAETINEQQDLSKVKEGAHDELFHYNNPVLAGVDVSSLYCYLLSQEKQRDADTWAITLWDLQKQGLNLNRVIADTAEGLVNGHKIAMPDVPCHADNFHITKSLTELRQFFNNKRKSAITYREKMEDKMNKAKKHGNSQKYCRKLGNAKKHEAKMCDLYESICTLVSWMEHDVLNKAGPNPIVRRELYDFILDEFKKLAKIHPHRIKSICTTLHNQKESLLAFVDLLDTKFQKLAERFCYPTEVIWQMCELQRCEFESDNYNIRSVPLQLLLKNQFDPVEDAVIEVMNSTERTSSMVENLNSRIKPYLFLRREIGSNYLELLRFYLNHSHFMRSSNPKRVGKTPAALLTGVKHQHWLKMLGFDKFQRQIAIH